MIPINSQAYGLLHEGVKTLSIIEGNGIKIDTDYLNSAIDKAEKTIRHLTAEIKKDEVFKTWQRVYGVNTNLGSKTQLGHILFDVLKYENKEITKSGRYKTDEGELKHIKIPFVKNLLQIEKTKKANSTYLKGIQKETCNGFLHPFFNLNTTETYRSSSDRPNFQNIPVRLEEIKKLVRRAFVSRGKDWQIIEADFKGVEVCVAACYHKDPRMVSYIKNPKKDLHRDMAGQCYLLPKEEITKEIRHCGKNRFVFPEFYGSIYPDCAKSLWGAIDELGIITVSGIPLYKHLRKHGIKSLGTCDIKHAPEENTFEKHIQEVENDFWNRRFKVYTKWKNDWWFEYLKKGYFETLTGFRIEGCYRRNQIINFPVQGSAFHCLLWTLIQFQKKLTKYKMKSLIVGQIHDSIIGDVHKKESKSYCEILQEIVKNELPKHYSWINVPMSIEIEKAPFGGSWLDKKGD